jgi:hypothetical protein
MHVLGRRNAAVEPSGHRACAYRLAVGRALRAGFVTEFLEYFFARTEFVAARVAYVDGAAYRRGPHDARTRTPLTSCKPISTRASSPGTERVMEDFHQVKAMQLPMAPNAQHVRRAACEMLQPLF